MTPASAAEGSIARRCGPGLRASRAAPPRLRACPQRHPSCGQAAGAPALPCPRSVACVLPTMHAHMLTRDAAPLLQRRCHSADGTGRATTGVRPSARPHDRMIDRATGPAGVRADRPATVPRTSGRDARASKRAERAEQPSDRATRPGDPTGRATEHEAAGRAGSCRRSRSQTAMSRHPPSPAGRRVSGPARHI